mmetsp:Transcript_8334/g.11662  ORF Transcript_8334/g.11662 Transcript_8334/m.11662 type:complete len:269 (-) Transcript_8334:317-1123(-)
MKPSLDLRLHRALLLRHCPWQILSQTSHHRHQPQQLRRMCFPLAPLFVILPTVQSRHIFVDFLVWLPLRRADLDMALIALLQMLVQSPRWHAGSSSAFLVEQEPRGAPPFKLLADDVPPLCGRFSGARVMTGVPAILARTTNSTLCQRLHWQASLAFHCRGSMLWDTDDAHLVVEVAKIFPVRQVAAHGLAAVAGARTLPSRWLTVLMVVKVYKFTRVKIFEVTTMTAVVNGETNFELDSDQGLIIVMIGATTTIPTMDVTRHRSRLM